MVVANVLDVVDWLHVVECLALMSVVEWLDVMNVIQVVNAVKKMNLLMEVKSKSPDFTDCPL